MAVGREKDVARKPFPDCLQSLKGIILLSPATQLTSSFQNACAARNLMNAYIFIFVSASSHETKQVIIQDAAKTWLANIIDFFTWSVETQHIRHPDILVYNKFCKCWHKNCSANTIYCKNVNNIPVHTVKSTHSPFARWMCVYMINSEWV